MREVGRYSVEDPSKVQGRDDVVVGDRNLAALRLEAGLHALEGVTGSVLMLGCGAGRYVRALHRARPDLLVFGGDLSQTAVREARGRDASAHYVALDASKLPYQDAAFGGVLFFDLMEHVPDYTGMLAEIHRVLRPGGVLHFFVPLEAQRGTLYSALRRNWPIPIHLWKRDHVGHIHRFTAGTVLHAVWQAGLPVETTAYSFHLIGQIHDVIDYWQRERNQGGTGLLPLGAVQKISRLAFIPTWRLSYLEDRLYSGSRLASGIHVTARKPDS